ncbi:MAG TPA: hypothetical protein PKW35_08465 [Nannocystaceae bacterium]|nr:hypothetical protein [Nannocystaceae bacterium]
MDRKRLVIDLFCEDRGHEQFARAMLRRLADEDGLRPPEINPGTIRGGHGRAIEELRLWQRMGRGRGDLLVVLIDANGEGWHQQRANVEAAVMPVRRNALVIGCPDPHIEAWIAADLDAVHRVLGVRLQPPTGRKVNYKAWLGTALMASGVHGLTDPADVALDVIPQLDLFRAGKASASLRDFIDTARSALRSVGAHGAP